MSLTQGPPIQALVPRILANLDRIEALATDPTGVLKPRRTPGAEGSFMGLRQSAVTT